MSIVLERPTGFRAASPTGRNLRKGSSSFLASEPIERNVSTRALQMDALADEASPEIETAWVATLEKLESFRQLGDDWDGQGACAPTDDIVDSAIALLNAYRERKELLPPSAIAPSPDGSVLIVWQEPDGTYCEIEVVRLFYAEVMLKCPGQATLHWTIPS
jgi:hypothetical protein